LEKITKDKSSLLGLFGLISLKVNKDAQKPKPKSQSKTKNNLKFSISFRTRDMSLKSQKNCSPLKISNKSYFSGWFYDPALKEEVRDTSVISFKNSLFPP
jgi:hypothetical protein